MYKKNLILIVQVCTVFYFINPLFLFVYLVQVLSWVLDEYLVRGDLTQDLYLVKVRDWILSFWCLKKGTGYVFSNDLLSRALNLLFYNFRAVCKNIGN